MDVHLRDLRYFVAVAEELSFTRAATERLFISQPALSKQIRQLETTLNVTLFDRERRSIRLTAAGEALLVHAREVMTRWDEASELMGEAAAAQRSRLTVGFQTSIGRGLWPRISACFAQRQPDWGVDFQQVAWADASAGLLSGSTDVAILWLPVPDPDAISWRELLSEPRWVALPAAHRLARRRTIPFRELLEEPFLALPSAAGPLRDYWLATEERGNHRARVAGEVSSADEAFEAVAYGVGLVLLAQGNVDLYQPAGVVFRPVSGLSPSTLAVAWRSRDERLVVRDFVKACAQACDGSAGDPVADMRRVG
ncbi:MAG: LysR family transcriptional regulator [Thermoleophilaceae bacterium]